MQVQLHHVAICTDQFEASVQFYKDVFGMTVDRTQGEAPHRKVWFCEGIQLNEGTPAGNSLDHIGLWVPDQAATLEKAKAHGCKGIEGRPNWFLTPQGVVIELAK
ncbi:MAG: VOC family protein [Oscillospiraceae bacterium]|nr:VOC family protein [Oscillospiraceae bacterium]